LAASPSEQAPPANLAARLENTGPDTSPPQPRQSASPTSATDVEEVEDWLLDDDLFDWLDAKLPESS
jgi:hypothetical protein